MSSLRPGPAEPADCLDRLFNRRLAEDLRMAKANDPSCWQLDIGEKGIGDPDSEEFLAATGLEPSEIVTAKEISDAIANSSHLKNIYFQRIMFDKGSAHKIASAIEKTNSCLEILYFNDTMGLGAKGVAAIAAAINENSSGLNVRELLFSPSCIDDEGAEALAKMLEGNETIVSLCLNSNNIKAKGMAALARALCTNTTLVEFSVGGQEDEESIAFSTASTSFATMLAKHNSTLEKLDLKNIPMSDEDVLKLLNSLRNNHKVDLEIDHTNASKLFEDRVRALSSINEQHAMDPFEAERLKEVKWSEWAKVDAKITATGEEGEDGRGQRRSKRLGRSA